MRHPAVRCTTFRRYGGIAHTQYCLQFSQKLPWVHFLPRRVGRTSPKPYILSQHLTWPIWDTLSICSFLKDLNPECYEARILWITTCSNYLTANFGRNGLCVPMRRPAGRRTVSAGMVVSPTPKVIANFLRVCSESFRMHSWALWTTVGVFTVPSF